MHVHEFPKYVFSVTLQKVGHLFNKIKDSQSTTDSSTKNAVLIKCYTVCVWAHGSTNSPCTNNIYIQQMPRLFQEWGLQLNLKWTSLVQCYRFLVDIYHNLPTDSPVDKRWPRFSFLFKQASDQLRVIHHKWRVRVLLFWIVNLDTAWLTNWM